METVAQRWIQAKQEKGPLLDSLPWSNLSLSDRIDLVERAAMEGFEKTGVKTDAHGNKYEEFLDSARKLVLRIFRLAKPGGGAYAAVLRTLV